MDIQLINIGFGNIVSANRIIAIVSPESAPIKRIITYYGFFSCGTLGNTAGNCSSSLCD